MLINLKDYGCDVKYISSNPKIPFTYCISKKIIKNDLLLDEINKQIKSLETIINNNIKMLFLKKMLF